MVATFESFRLSLSAIHYEQQRLVEKTRLNQRTHSQFKESRLKSIDYWNSLEKYHVRKEENIIKSHYIR